MKATTILIVVGLVAWNVNEAQAVVRNVNSGIYYPTITQAVNAASLGDDLHISTGAYFESIMVQGKRLTLDGGYQTNCTVQIAGAKSYITKPPLSGTALSIMNATCTVANIAITGVLSMAYNIRNGSVVTARQCVSSYNTANTLGFGGGMTVRENSKVSLEGVELVYNIAPQMGGGLYVDGSTVTISNNTELISENRAGSNGGGMYITNSVVRCTGLFQVRNNVAGVNGGGICVVGSGTRLQVSEGRLYQNRANATNTVTDLGGGGMAVINGASVDLINTYITYNASSNYGGGIACYKASLSISGEYSKLVDYLRASIVDGNSVPEDRYGGGIMLAGSSRALISQAWIQGNTAGGGGGIYVYDSSTCDVINCVIMENDAVNEGDGARSAGGGRLRMLYCTVANNHDIGIDTGAGGTVSMTNCIVWSHTATQVTAGQNVHYSDIQGGYATGTGNTNVYPLFKNTNTTNYTLLDTSPVIDKGIAVPGITIDLAGQPRVQGGTPDMGAYEAVPEPAAALLLALVLAAIRTGRRHMAQAT